MYPSFSTLRFFLMYSSSSFFYNYSVPHSPVFSVSQYRMFCTKSRFWLYSRFHRYILSLPSSVFYIVFGPTILFYTLLAVFSALNIPLLILDSGSSFFCILSLLLYILLCLSSPTILLYTLLSSLFSICNVLHWILASEFWFYVSLSSIFCSVSIFLFLLYSVLFLYFSFFYILFCFYISFSSIFCSLSIFLCLLYSVLLCTFTATAKSLLSQNSLCPLQVYWFLHYSSHKYPSTMTSQLPFWHDSLINIPFTYTLLPLTQKVASHCPYTIESSVKHTNPTSYYLMHSQQFIPMNNHYYTFVT